MKVLQKIEFFPLLFFILVSVIFIFGLYREGLTKEEFGQIEKRGNGPITLILVPCLGCDATSFKTFMERNLDRYTMYAITWPGLGKTALPKVKGDSPTPYYDYITKAMANLIRKENLDKPVIIGHSGAAPAVIKFAYEYPELISKAVNVDAIITNKDTLNFTQKQRIAWADKEFEEVMKNYDQDEAWEKLNTASTKSLGDLADFYTKMWRTPPRENVLAYWKDWLRVDAGMMVANLSVPVLGIYAIRPGTEDPEAIKKAQKERIETNTCGSNFKAVFVEDAYHTIWESNPEGFEKALEENLR